MGLFIQQLEQRCVLTSNQTRCQPLRTVQCAELASTKMLTVTSTIGVCVCVCVDLHSSVLVCEKLKAASNIVRLACNGGRGESLCVCQCLSVCVCFYLRGGLF